MLKELEVEASITMSIIFNQSMTESIVTADWKLGNVTSIYKKGPQGQPGEPMPSVPHKRIMQLLESIIKANIRDHLIGNNLMRPSQHGFKPW